MGTKNAPRLGGNSIVRSVASEFRTCQQVSAVPDPVLPQVQVSSDTFEEGEQECPEALDAVDVYPLVGGVDPLQRGAE